jgi:hypothetical protein
MAALNLGVAGGLARMISSIAPVITLCQINYNDPRTFAGAMGRAIAKRAVELEKAAIPDA